mmetsp:Transcript_85135/g.216856  ORF Transcript_85135/g.216856 Transcript_85135/m.216856 type:complete len:292 (+) Transcript_85135:464-1339(+)
MVEACFLELGGQDVVVELDGVLHQACQVVGGVAAKKLDIQMLAVVPVVVEGDMLLGHARSIKVFHIVPEGPDEQVELKAETHERPILESEVCEQWLAVAHVVDVLDGEDVLRRLGGLLHLFLGLHLLLFLLLPPLGHHRLIALLLFLLGGGLLRFLLTLLRLLLLALRGDRPALRGRNLLRKLSPLSRFCGLLLCSLLRRLLSGEVLLVVLLLQLPLLEHLLPLRQPVVEPRGGKQILKACRQLPLQDPLLEVHAAHLLVLPIEAELVEAVLLLGEREEVEATVQHVATDV